MSSSNEKLLDAAIPHLKIQNIYLFESSFKRPSPQPDAEEVPAVIMLKREVRLAHEELPSENAPRKKLQVLVDLGLRVAANDVADQAERPIYIQIEAIFLAEYEVSGDVSDDALRVFAEQNSVHNVWPFWRQHVFDIVQRGELPHLDVPLYSIPKIEDTALPPEPNPP
jgi:preprotein translocase subunit SecB